VTTSRIIDRALPAPNRTNPLCAIEREGRCSEVTPSTQESNMTSPTERTGDVARSVAAETSHAASSVVDTAKAEGRILASETGQQARELFEDARSTARSELDSQTHRAAEGLSHLSDQFSAMADNCSEPDGLPAQMSRRVGDGLGQAARKLDEQGIDGMTADIRRYAARNPGPFLLGAAAAGFVVGRIVRNANQRKMLDAAKERVVGDNGQQTQERSSAIEDGGPREPAMIDLTQPAVPDPHAPGRPQPGTPAYAGRDERRG
jgi:hypothetical protein